MRWSSLVAAVACLALTTTAHADLTPSEQAIAEATALADKGEFALAAAKFRDAYAADPRPELICNVGVAYYKAKDYPHAFRFLEQCLASGTSLDPAFIATVRQVVGAVDSKLRADEFTPIDITVAPPTATTVVETAGRVEEPLVGSRRTWIAYGPYKLTIHAEGYVDKVVEGVARSRAPITANARLELPPTITAGSGSSAPPPPPPPPLPRSKTRAVITTTVAGTAGLAALGFYVMAKRRANDAGEAMSFTAYERLASAARSWQSASWIAGGIGGATALAATYLWVRALQAPGQVEVAVTPSGAAVMFGAAF